MARDHYVPAAFIGRFSASASGSRRVRPVLVARRGQNSVHSVKPDKIGFVNDLYALTEPGVERDAVDEVWSAFEGDLQQALDALAAGVESIPTDTWLRVIVPFLASLFVRGREFADRFRTQPFQVEIKRRAELGGGQPPAVPVEAGVLPPEFDTEEFKRDFYISRDSLNRTRLFQLHRLLSLVLSADVTVLHSATALKFVGNDLAAALTSDSETGRTGWAIPLDGDTVLGLFPSSGRAIATWISGEWRTTVRHEQFPADLMEVQRLNDAVASAAVEFIYGADRSELTRARQSFAGQPTTAAVLSAWPQSVELRRTHELEWWRLADAIRKSPSDLKGHNFQRPDFVEVKQGGWAPVPIIAANMPEYRTGVSYVADRAELRVDLHPEPLGLDSTGRPYWDPASRVIYAGSSDRRAERKRDKKKAKRKASAMTRRRNR